MMIGNLALVEQRRVPRDEVLYHTRGHSEDGRALSLLIVNISPSGLMARCDDRLAEGDRVNVVLPRIGGVGGLVRWSLGGRFGCEFDRPVPLALYDISLATMTRA